MKEETAGKKKCIVVVIILKPKRGVGGWKEEKDEAGKTGRKRGK